MKDSICVSKNTKFENEKTIKLKKVKNMEKYFDKFIKKYPLLKIFILSLLTLWTAWVSSAEGFNVLGVAIGSVAIVSTYIIYKNLKYYIEKQKK